MRQSLGPSVDARTGSFSFRSAGLRALVTTVMVLVTLGGCRGRESPEITLARSRETFLRGQIRGLEEMIGRAERGELTTTDQIAIGLSENLAKNLLEAALPIEVDVAGRLHIRVEGAQAVFGGTKAAVLFRATASSIDLPDVSASIDIAGTLDDFTLTGGRLRARVALAHFAVLESGMGDLAADVLDRLVRDNAKTIQQAIPPVEFPVELDQVVKIGGFTEGAVVTSGGSLPLEVSVSQVIVGTDLLWILLKAEVGSWKVAASPPEKRDGGAR